MSTLVATGVWSGGILAFAYAFVNVFPGLLGRVQIAPAKYVWLVAWALVVLWVLYLPFAVLRDLTTRYALTDRDVHARAGLLPSTVTRVGVDEVGNTTVRRGAVGSLLKYGSVQIDTGGAGTDLSLDGLASPEQFRAALHGGEETERVDGDEESTAVEYTLDQSQGTGDRPGGA